MRDLLLSSKRSNAVRGFGFLRSFFFRDDKRALSNMIGYVLLISITISLSVLVYGWLRFSFTPEPLEECSDNVNVIIRDYNCTLPTTVAPGNLTIYLKNKGLFTVGGYEIRVHNRTGADFGVYLFNDTGTSIIPGGEQVETYLFNSTGFVYTPLASKIKLRDITLLEVQPFMIESGNIRCRSHASQEIICV